MNNWKKLPWTYKLWVVGLAINMLASAFVIYAVLTISR